MYRLFLLSFLFLSCHTTRSLPATQAKTLSLPVLAQDFPDPTVIYRDNLYYAYATNSSVDGKYIHIQVASSPDLQHWTFLGDALPQPPVWANRDFWAPHVLYDSVLQQYVMFYSGTSVDPAYNKCLGVAFSKTPQGPFTDKGTPLICGSSFYNIDPMALVDPVTKKKCLFWGSNFGPLKMQEMTDDWKDFKKGSVLTEVLQPDKEKNYDKLIEGSWVDYDKGKYYLYYSGNNCCDASAHYAVMVARADKIEGPYTRLGDYNKTGNSVILEKDSAWNAPGHNSIVADKAGRKWIAYHAIPVKATGPGRYSRFMCISPVVYGDDGWPKVIR